MKINISQQLSAEREFWNELYLNEKELPWLYNPFPRNVIESFLNRIDGAQRILDYGCGNGRYGQFFLDAGKDVLCADISDVALDYCKIKYPKIQTIQVEEPDALELGEFDAIFCWGVLHHINPDGRFRFWRGLAKSLRHNSILLIGGWSSSDPQFRKEARISPVTRRETWDVDANIETFISANNLQPIQRGIFNFIEYGSERERIFSWYLLKK